MQHFFTTKLGRLRLLALLEGISLIVLIFIAVPLKRIGGDPSLVAAIGPIHGMLFLLFIFATFSYSIEAGWSFWKKTWKVLLSCFFPFGTFYVDYKILRPLQATEKS